MNRLSNLSSLQIFQLFRYAGFIVIGIGLAKLQLPQSEIAQFETFLLISGTATYFWVSGIINSMLTLFPKQEEEGQQSLLYNTFISLAGFALLAGVALFLFSGNALSFLDKTGSGTLVRLSVIYLLLNSPAFVNEYILFLYEKKKELLLYAFATAAANILAVLIPVVLQWPLVYSLYGLTGVSAGKLLVSLFLINRYGKYDLRRDLLSANMRFSLPVMASIFVSGSAEYVDGIIIKHRFDSVAFAVYRYGAKELPVLLIIANTFSSAMLPVLGKNMDSGLTELKTRTAKLMDVFFPLSMVLMALSPFIYRYVFSEAFIYSAVIFNIYLLLAIPRLVFPQAVTTSIHKPLFLFISSMLEIIINVTVSIYLSFSIGIAGVALGTLAAYFFDKTFLIAVNYVAFGIKPTQYIPFARLLIYSILLLLTFGITYHFMLKT